MSIPYAVVRNGREVLAVGAVLEEALEAATNCFYAGELPPGLEIVDRPALPLPPLAAVPCSTSLLTASTMFGYGPVVLAGGVLCPEGEDQLSLF